MKLRRLTENQMRNRAIKAFHVQKELYKKGHQAVPHIKMTEAFLWSAAAEVMKQGHGVIASMPARRIALNLNKICSQITASKFQGKRRQDELTEFMQEVDKLLEQSQKVLDKAEVLCGETNDEPPADP